MRGIATRNLKKQFGGLVAVNDVNFSLERGEIVGIIGPNGAGKSTLINLISGVDAPTEGSIHFNEQDVTAAPSHEKSRMGIARTFQTIHPLEDLNLRENVMVGFIFSRKLSQKQAWTAAEDLCRSLGLEEPDRPISRLNILEIKKMEIAHALASGPEVLFLDEIMAGLNSSETVSMIELIRKVAEDFHLGVGVVEHVMGVIRELTDRVIVLENGEVIARGPYDEVSRDPRVMQAYLGGALDA